VYNEQPSTKRIVLTLVGWGAGLLAVFGLIFAISNAIAPTTPPPPSPGATSSSATVTPTVAPATPAVAVPTPPPPVYVPPAQVSTLPSTTAPPPARATAKIPRTSPQALTGKVVVIDAGHQAKGDSSLEPIGPGASEKKPKVASGATGVKTHNPESRVNLWVALKLEKELERRGAKVVMVRRTQNVNISNSARAEVANRKKADLFIRLHCDGAGTSSVTGLSTLVPKSNKWTKPIVSSSKKAASYVHRAVIAETQAKNRGVVSRGDMTGFNWSEVPTVLIEMGFLSSPAEDVKLSRESYQDKLAKGLAKGIENYLKKN